MKKMELSPSKMTVVCAIVMIAATAGAWFFLKKQQDRLANGYQMATVVRGKRYIGAGKSVQMDMVEETEIPVAFIPPGTLTRKSELLSERGKPKFRARIGIPKGGLLTKSQMTDDSALMGLSWTLQPGETAVSLRLNLDDAVAGLIRPGDSVHVFWTEKGRSQLLLANVRVGAVQDKLWESAAASEAGDFSKTMASDSILITLILPARDAMLARVAAAKARLTLALASPLETDPPTVERVTEKDL